MSVQTNARARVQKFAETNAKHLGKLGVDLLARYDHGSAQVREAILQDVDRGSRRARVQYFSERTSLGKAALETFCERNAEYYRKIGFNPQQMLQQFAEADEDRRADMLQDIDGDQPSDEDDRSLLRQFTDKYPNLLAKRGTSATEFVENVMALPPEERAGVLQNVTDALGDGFSDEPPSDGSQKLPLFRAIAAAR